jgi:hypothetical protein
LLPASTLDFIVASICAGLLSVPASALDFCRCQPPRWTFVLASNRAGLLLLVSTSSSTASLHAGLVFSFSSTSSSMARVPAGLGLYFVDIVIDGQLILLDLNHCQHQRWASLD